MNWIIRFLLSSIAVVLGMDDEFIRAGLSVYPNPGNDSFTFQWANPVNEPCALQIVNLMGQEIFSGLFTGSSLTWKGETSTGNSFQRGVYIVSLTNSKGSRILAKLIKE